MQTIFIDIVGDLYQKLCMWDKYQKLKKQQPPSNGSISTLTVEGKRVKIQSQILERSGYANKEVNELSVEPTSAELNSYESEVDELDESVIPSSLS